LDKLCEIGLFSNCIFWGENNHQSIMGVLQATLTRF
jgi:hypothetical protein